MGEGESVRTERPFHICVQCQWQVPDEQIQDTTRGRGKRRGPKGGLAMKAVDNMSPNWRTWPASCRGFIFASIVRLSLAEAVGARRILRSRHKSRALWTDREA